MIEMRTVSDENLSPDPDHSGPAELAADDPGDVALLAPKDESDFFSAVSDDDAVADEEIRPAGGTWCTPTPATRTR
jgi:hypothetical protein